MKLIKLDEAKGLIAGRHWMGKGSWEELDKAASDTVSGIAQAVKDIHQQGKQQRRKATPQDIKDAYAKHREKYVVEHIEGTTDRIKEAIEKVLSDIKKGVRVYYGETQATLPKGPEKE